MKRLIFPAILAATLPSVGIASESQKLSDTIGKCWNIGFLSLNALRGDVTVSFHILESGTIDRESIKLISSSTPPERTDFAFQSARRALLRCLGPGEAPNSSWGADYLATFRPREGILIERRAPFLVDT